MFIFHVQHLSFCNRQLQIWMEAHQGLGFVAQEKYVLVVFLFFYMVWEAKLYCGQWGQWQFISSGMTCRLNLFLQPHSAHWPAGYCVCTAAVRLWLTGLFFVPYFPGEGTVPRTVYIQISSYHQESLRHWTFKNRIIFLWEKFTEINQSIFWESTVLLMFSERIMKIHGFEFNLALIYKYMSVLYIEIKPFPRLKLLCVCEKLWRKMLMNYFFSVGCKILFPLFKMDDKDLCLALCLIMNISNTQRACYYNRICKH